MKTKYPRRITVSMWECGEHRHQTKQAAAQCIEGQPRRLAQKKKRMAQERKWAQEAATKEASTRAFFERDRGVHYRLASMIPSRPDQSVDVLPSLSSHGHLIRNQLLNHGLKTKGEVWQHFLNDERVKREGVSSLPNVGKFRTLLIVDWLLGKHPII